MFEKYFIEVHGYLSKNIHARKQFHLMYRSFFVFICITGEYLRRRKIDVFFPIYVTSMMVLMMLLLAAADGGAAADAAMLLLLLASSWCCWLLVVHHHHHHHNKIFTSNCDTQ